MDLLVIIFGILGWVYNSFPLLVITLILSSIGFILSSELLGMKKESKLSTFIALAIYVAGIIFSLVRIL